MATATVTNFLSNLISNPFSTPVGQLIEKATDVSQASEDWALYMEICDVINETEDGPRDAARALKKQITNNIGKSNTVIMYTLTILETCVKNCGLKFHIQIAQKDFLQELIKLASPRTNPPHFVLDKVLGLIQTWADAFRDEPELKEFGAVYEELKEKGCEFPMTDLDCIPPIHTPARSVPQVVPQPHIVGSADSSHNTSLHRVPGDGSAGLPLPTTNAPPAVLAAAVSDGDTGPVWLEAVQLAKLRSELDVVQTNCRVFGELMTELIPGQEQSDDTALLQELNVVCRDMQSRIVQLIEHVQNEEVTGELLQVNDLLNNVALRYERYERLRAGTNNTACATNGVEAATLPLRTPAASSAPPMAPVAASQTGQLVDVSDVTVNMNSCRVTADQSAVAPSATVTAGEVSAPAGDTAEFDMFAQSRLSFEQNLPKVNRSAYQDQEEDQAAGSLAAAVTHKSKGSAFQGSDVDEMEQWLRSTEVSAAAKESATSSEFDKFLATRQKEVSSIPTVECESEPLVAEQQKRKLQNADDESALFSL